MRLVIAFLLALVLGPTLAGCDRQKAAAPQGEAEAEKAAPASSPEGRLDRSRAGQAAPDLVFEDPDGAPARLADFRGKPLLVNLWATWCAPCIVEMPSLDRLAQREEGRLTVLAVSQDVEGRQKVTGFFAERGFERLEPYLDPELAFMTSLGIGTLPTTILYDAEGREVWRMTGIADWEGGAAARLIAEAEGGAR